MKQGRNEIAVCTFQNRVCSRFDLSREILIYDSGAPENGPVEKIDASSLSPAESLNVLVRKEVQAVIVGGIQERYQAMFFSHQVKVMWGVIGEVNDVILAYTKGTLYPGIGTVTHRLNPENPK
jgi:predicted Fe-Mo cluster-binding NifX family protein